MGLTARWVIIALVLGWSIYVITPLSESIKLGLDLQGGMHILLNVDTDKAIEGKIDSAVLQVRKDLQAEKIQTTYVRKENKYNLAVGFDDNNVRQQIVKLMEKNYPYLEQTGLENNVVRFGIKGQEETRWRQDAVEQSIEVLRNRIDAYGVEEPLIQKQGEKQVVVQLPGRDNITEAMELIGKTAVLSFHLVDSNVTDEDIRTGKVPYDDIVLPYKDAKNMNEQSQDSGFKMALKREPLLTGGYISDASVTINNTDNMPAVLINFDPAGAKLFEQITRDNVGKSLAIVLDGTIYSAPRINEAIAGGGATITGNFTFNEAKNLEIVLKAGSLPAPVTVAENRTVGASLGDDSIRSGVKASIIGFALIVLFIGIYYRGSGMIANLALILNLVIILAVLAMFRATLTLPGIAGIMLTLGMAVDANVLIFERVREELRNGKTPATSIDIGYSKALSAIVDSNLTSLIAAVVLFQFGTGPIKGFAITLSVGLIASMFTAIFVTKTIFMSLMYKRTIKKLSI